MPWRIATALDPGDHPVRWLDLEVARQRAVRANPGLTHNAHLFRSPLTTLDDHLARGLRVEALRELLTKLLEQFENIYSYTLEGRVVLPGQRVCDLVDRS